MTTRADELARQAYQAFNSRDREGLLEKVTEDVTWESPGNGPTAGTYHGRDEVWEGVFSKLWDAPARLEFRDSVSSDQHAAIRADLVVELGDEESRWPFIETVRIEDGRIAERRSVMDHQERFDQFLAKASQQLASQGA